MVITLFVLSIGEATLSTRLYTVVIILFVLCIGEATLSIRLYAVVITLDPRH